MTMQKDLSQAMLELEDKECEKAVIGVLITEDEYNKLLKAADNNQNILSKKLLEMNNSKDVPKNCRSIYRTCLNWLNRDKK